jgi:uncharacterized protein (TIGR03000 family)
MSRTTSWTIALVLAGLVWLGVGGRVDAAYTRPSPYPVSPGVSRPAHMPGWDWRRTYPWSPYNYGRNPYNPIIVPYPYYVSPYPYPVPAGPAYTPAPPAQPPVAADPSADLPTVSGPLTTPPPGTALLRVRVPDTWATVSFNGQDSVTSGTQRTFVTPRLPSGGNSYTVSASWARGGQPVRQQQVVNVLPGQTSVIDFGR